MTTLTLTPRPVDAEPAVEESPALEELRTGDVIEVETLAGGAMSALVLLATDRFLVLDPCDDSTPFVVQHDELRRYRRFDGS